MLKRLLAGVTLFAALLLLALVYLTGRYRNREEIHRAQLELQGMRTMRDSILIAVQLRDSIQQTLQVEVGELRRSADAMREEVLAMERQRQRNQLAVRQLRTSDAVQAKFLDSYPEVAGAFRVSTVRDPVEDVELEYLMVPLFFSETFIIEHENAQSWLAQKDGLLKVDSLQFRTIGLQDSVISLERQNRTAFQTGFNEAFAKYEDINRRYIGVLERPPQLTLGLPKWQLLLATAAGGVVLGTQIK
ncbi:MAG: hypothetical protein M3373_11680 [Gemmatimonadota bacterium]|nr:hypothetical protein [Gemmatimonadota bacterium]